MSHQFYVIIDQDAEGYFVASVPALPGRHTQAKSLDELMERIREAIELCLEVEGPHTEFQLNRSVVFPEDSSKENSDEIQRQLSLR